MRSRDTAWAKATAAWLARLGVRPNVISVASVFFAGLAGLGFFGSGRLEGPWNGWALVGAAAGMQLRLLCNLFDGMVAVEGGFRTKSGEIYNELPDRVADVVILLGLGYARPDDAWLVALGWMGSVLAVLTAYVRALGAVAGAGQHFEGPMAKPQRMALLTGAAVVGAVLEWFNVDWPWARWVLGVLVAGCVITVVRRVIRIIRHLESA